MALSTTRPAERDGLPAGVAEWIAEVTGGPVIAVERRIHARPMWIATVRAPEGDVEIFVRGERGSGSALAAVYDLEREARVVASLSAAGVATSRFLGHRRDLGVMLLERIAGESDVDGLDERRRTAVALSFAELLADLHALDPAALAIAGLAIPSTPEEHALAELEVAEGLLAEADVPPEPFITFGRWWLRAHVPQRVDATVLVQGDTGPGNFLFSGDRVTHLVDWEIAHFGDPMEDLAAVCVRDMVTPFAALPAVFARYAERSGRPVDLARVRYHRVSKCVRSLVAITTYAHHARRPDEVALWHGWRALYLRSGCQAVIEAESAATAPADPDRAGVLPRSTPLGSVSAGSVLPPVAAGALAPWFGIVQAHLAGVGPLLGSELDRHQLDGAMRVLEMLATESARRPSLDEMERDDLARVLGSPVGALDDGLAALDAQIVAQTGPDDAAVLAYLCRRADRLASALRPLMGSFADHRFNPIE
jgi:aminoglycoside phosphotransferase (APT) family kinase protein